MGSISASIELYDQMSAPLHNIMNAMNMTISTMYDMNEAMSTEMDTSFLDSARDSINQANAAMENLVQSTQSNASNIQRNTSEQNEFNRSLQFGNSNASELGNTIKSLVGAYLTIESVKSVLDASDELTLTRARVDMMNDGLQSTDELMNMIYQSAQDARGSFGDMADVVARFGNNAKDAFDSNQEVVAFANLVQKQMTIAGASTQEASNAMLQLSQALGSGVLRGDELNSIFEQAPNLIQSIADYLDVPIGQIRAMAQEGELTADIVKSAIFASTDDINSKFESMPMTWGQVWTSFKNDALMTFQPVLQKVNELANNQKFKSFVSSTIGLMSTLAVYTLSAFETIGNVAGYVSENWSSISPIIYGVIAALVAYESIMFLVNSVIKVASIVQGVWSTVNAIATASQLGLNAALDACPITWIVAAVIALIAIIYAVCAAIAKATGVANSGFGLICGGINLVIQTFWNLLLVVANIFLGIGNAIATLTSNIVTAFSNAIKNVQSFFYNLLSTALSVVSQIANALNKLPFVEIDVSGISSAAEGFAAKAQATQETKGSYESVGDAFKDGATTFDAFKKGWAADAFKNGTSFGDGVANKISGVANKFKGASSVGSQYDPNVSDYASQIANNTSKAADSASKAADSASISEENLKYLRDIAEQETVNRFTTAEITVNQTNNNNVSSDVDVDGMVANLTDGVNEALNIAAEGVHK